MQFSVMRQFTGFSFGLRNEQQASRLSLFFRNLKFDGRQKHILISSLFSMLLIKVIARAHN